MNELNEKHRKEEHQIALLRDSRVELHESIEKVHELESALEAIRSRLSDGLAAEEKRKIVELMVASAVIKTEGDGHRKKGTLQLRLRWGEISTPLISEHQK